MHRMMFKGLNRTDNETGRIIPVFNSIVTNYFESTNNSSMPPVDHKNLNSTSYDDYLRFLLNTKYSNHYSSDNFFYQHVFNFSLVLIFLLQVLLVWTFLCTKRRQEEEDEDLNIELGDILDNALFVQPDGQGAQNLPVTGPAPAG